MNNHEEYNDCKTEKNKKNPHEEKSSKFFLNLEESRAIQGQVRTIIYNDKEII